MTLLDAAALAILGHRHRPAMAALTRLVTGQASDEDTAATPPRLPGEPLLDWFCRTLGRDGETPSAVAGMAAGQLAHAAALGLIPLPIGDARYPVRLAAIRDAPPILWLRGQVTALTTPAVAVVGSRAASHYGLTMARRLAADLTAAGVTVVSGLARGVDAEAHAAVIAGHGCTVGVLGCGLDRVYPSEHRLLAAEMGERGALVSEFPTGVPPLAHHFPLRNRIISALSSGVVVVEAPEKSGALITAAAALEQGRDVLVVPGPVDGRNRGGHQLIRDGARIVESAADILRELGLQSTDDHRSLPGLVHLDPAGFTADDVAAETGQSTATVLADLLELELSGKIQRIGGGRFARVLT